MLGPTARAFGTPMPSTYGGKEVLVFGRIQEFYPAAETEYIRRHPKAMDLYESKASSTYFAERPEERKDFLKFCVDKACEIQDQLPTDILNWLGTRAGTIWYGSRTMKWPPKDGEKAERMPFLTEAEVSDLFAEHVAAMIRDNVEKADNMERLAAEAENAAILAFHQAVNMASGQDMAGKETGPTSTRAPEGATRSG